MLSVVKIVKASRGWYEAGAGAGTAAAAVIKKEAQA
jgi:hypothetical protein